jgi:hypothetical protein
MREVFVLREQKLWNADRKKISKIVLVVGQIAREREFAVSV